MRQKRISFFFLTAGMLLVAGAMVLLTSTPAEAQCGSSVSSCKNCHEVQAQLPVNADGTAWHQSHAFGDFCYLCHAGNNQVMDKMEAHTGMVAPLSDLVNNCKSCHPNDYESLAQSYATTLGVAISSGSASTASTTAASSAAGTASSETVESVPPATAIRVDDPNLVDYVKRYNEIVLGIHPTNWGNVILIGLIALFVVVGGFMVLKREGLVEISFEESIKAGGRKKLPPDVLEIVPLLARLSASARRDLRLVLAKPALAKELLAKAASLAVNLKVSSKPKK